MGITKKIINQSSRPIISERIFIDGGGIEKKTSVPKILIEEHTKYYDKDGNIVPGVTAVIHQLSNESIVKWANNMGKEGVDYSEELKRAGIIGTATHLYLESKFTEDEKVIEKNKSDFKEIYAYCNRPMQNRIDASIESFEKWYKKNSSYNPTQFEYPIYSEKYKYGGTADALGYFEDIRTLFDYKTSNSFYYEHILQTSAYRKAILEMEKLNGIKNGTIKQVMIIKLDKKKGTTAKHLIVEKKDLKIYFETFLKLLDLYTYRKKVENHWDSILSKKDDE